jgi:hypothetical protein
MPPRACTANEFLTRINLMGPMYFPSATLQCEWAPTALWVAWQWEEKSALLASTDQAYLEQERLVLERT